MHHNLIIKNGDATQVEKEILVDGVQFIDKEPVEGSFNPVTSDGVAKAIGDANEAIGDANKELFYIKQLLTNPLGLPDKTIRCKFTSGYTPTMGTSQALVDAGENVWDIGFDGANQLFNNNTYLLKVLGANTLAVTTMNRMFNGCTNLVSVPLFDTSSVTDMYGMLSGCTSLVSVPLFDTASVTTMNRMFNGCPKLVSVPLFDTASVTDMNRMLSGCTNLVSVPLFDTASVTDMSYMLYGGTSLVSVPLFDTASVTDMSYMLSSCISVAGGALALYQQASTKNPQPSHTSTFTNCGANTVTGAAELAQIPTSWGGTAT